MKPKPLAKCCNGCDAKPHPPSFVLCKKCLDALTKRMEQIAANWPRRRRSEETMTNQVAEQVAKRIADLERQAIINRQAERIVAKDAALDVVIDALETDPTGILAEDPDWTRRAAEARKL